MRQVFKLKTRLKRRPKKEGDSELEGSDRVSSLSANSEADLTTAPAGPASAHPFTTTVTQSTPEQTVPPVQPSTPSSTPAASAQAAASSSTIPALSDDIDPWTRAYEICRDREPELMADYKTHLGSLQDNAAASGDLASPRSVESVVNKLLENREKKQWRVTLLHKDIKIREQAERLAKFLLWSDPIVKNALKSQPYAALAWSGVSLLLPVGI